MQINHRVVFAAPVNTSGLGAEVREQKTAKRGWSAPCRKLEPMVGIEPTTYGLRNRCSTTELHWLSMQVLEKAGESIRAGIGVVKRLARGFRVYGASG
jgi:hypothetical protein